jgi:putative membrane protein
MKKSNFFVRLLLNAVTFLVVAKIYGGLIIPDFGHAVVAALIWGILNAVLHPVLMLLTLPINILTLGLFTFIVNGVILLLTDKFYSGIQLTSFWAGVVAAFLFSIVNVILSKLFVKDDKKHN